MLDLVVIGAGLSGLMAAHTAVTSGLSVRVINKGLGSMHWSAGTVDLLGYTIEQQKQAIERPFDTLPDLIKNHPNHPYALVSEDDIRAALAQFQQIVADAGLPYGGAADGASNLFLPSPAGSPRPVFLAPQAQLAGDLSRTEPILIVGFEGMRDFYPQLIAENLGKLGYQARAAMLPLSLISSRKDINTIQMAHALDDGARRAQLGSELKRLVQPGERIGLPAILGFDQHMQVLADLERLTAVPVFEIPTLPPSVPGARLYAALRTTLQGLGVRIEPAMEVISANTAPPNGQPGRVQFVESSTSARPLKHRADKFVLATGGVLGGGFYSDYDGRVWETIFNLPLTAPQDRSEWFNSQFLSDKGHPVFQGGVSVNSQMQPVNPAGAVVYDNLWAAGGVLADTDPILERSLEGAAIVSGYAAGQRLTKKS